MAIVNWRALEIQLAKGSSGRALKKVAENRAEQIFEDAAAQMMEEFDEHKVTQEIRDGIDSDNVSKTLQGGEAGAPKNLYSFIGFDTYVDPDPTKQIADRLDPSNGDGPEMVYQGKETGKLRYKWRVNIERTKKAIYESTPMPWGRNVSWAKKIESGIQGFAYFLAKFGKPSSRSGGGIQVDSVVRNAEYVPPTEGYLTPIFNNFLNRIRGGNAGGGRRRDLKGRFKGFDQ